MTETPTIRLADRVRLWFLKRRARRLIRRIDAIHDDYDCGTSLVRHIAAKRIEPLYSAFHETMERIREIDPTAPRR